MIPKYELSKLRIEVIRLLSKSLKKDSKFYQEDYDHIVNTTNRKSQAQLWETYCRLQALEQVTESEINQNCQL